MLSSSMLRFVIVFPTESIVDSNPQKVPNKPKKTNTAIKYLLISLSESSLTITFSTCFSVFICFKLIASAVFKEDRISSMIFGDPYKLILLSDKI